MPMLHCIQITTAENVGPEAEEFLEKVRNASVGYPWYSESPVAVYIAYRSLCLRCSVYAYHSACVFVSYSSVVSVTVTFQLKCVVTIVI